jgi:hypothetical protein
MLRVFDTSESIYVSLLQNQGLQGVMDTVRCRMKKFGCTVKRILFVLCFFLLEHPRNSRVILCEVQ